MSSNSNKNTLEYWEQRRNKITTSVGKWIGGEDVTVYGHQIMKELLGKISYMQMIILNITGRLVQESIAKWLEGNFIGVSYPDARIWCNTIGALAGQSKTSVVSGTVAGILAADSRGYGGSQTSLYGMQFIQEALALYRNGQNIDNILSNQKFVNNKPIIVGYARPVAREDERLQPHIEMTRKLGFEEGEHLQLAWKINQMLKETYGLAINIAGYSCAFLSDQKFSPMEVYRIKSLMVSSGVTACFVDYYDRKDNCFLPQHCSDVEYTGPLIRRID